MARAPARKSLSLQGNRPDGACPSATAETLDNACAKAQGAPPIPEAVPPGEMLCPRHLPRGRDEVPVIMAKSDITGKRRMKAQNVSHSNIKTKRWQNVNVQQRRLWVPELGRFVSLNLTTRDIRTIDKIGLFEFAKRHHVKL